MSVLIVKKYTLIRIAGYHSVVWNADEFGSGIYFVQIIAGEYMDTQKLMLIK